ncbi:VDAC3, partial [Cervus elaphus hippelaphus]
KAAKDGCLHQRIWVWYSWIDLRDKFCSGGDFYTSGHAYTDAGKAPGKLETKYKISNYGLVYNKLAEGLKLTLDTILLLNTGKKSENLKVSYQWDCSSFGSNVDTDFSEPFASSYMNHGIEFGDSIPQKVRGRLKCPRTSL